MTENLSTFINDLFETFVFNLWIILPNCIETYLDSSQISAKFLPHNIPQSLKIKLLSLLSNFINSTFMALQFIKVCHLCSQYKNESPQHQHLTGFTCANKKL